MILSGLTKLWSLLTSIPRGWQIVFAVSLLVLAIMQLQRCAVKEAVEADRKAAQGEVAKKALEAERGANSADAIRQAEIQANDAAIRKAIDDAARKNPEPVPAGPITRSAVDGLRNR
jgi:hypothetical protein